MVLQVWDTVKHGFPRRAVTSIFMLLLLTAENDEL